MKKLLFMLFGLATFIVVVQSCKHEIPDPDGNGGNGNGNPTPVTQSDTCSWDTVYFVKEVLPIIISNCTGTECHDDIDPVDGIKLLTYDQIMSNGEIVPGNPGESKLYKVITDNDPNDKMPPPGEGSLTPEQIRALRIWIEQGAQNNDCNNGCDTSEYAFSTTIWPILNATCSGCHKGTSPSGGVAITNYATVKTIVDNGLLEKSVFHLAGASAMPPGGQLDSCSLQKVRKWLDDGAPNN